MPGTISPETDSATLLQQGITAAKQGNKDKARTYLLQLLELDDRNKKAWLWLSDVVQDPQEKAICLENVLAIDPNNSAANYGLQKLKLQYPEIFEPISEPAPPIVQPEGLYRSVEEDEHKTPDVYESLQATPPPVPQDTRAGRPSVRICIHCGAPNPGWRDLCLLCNKRVDGGSDSSRDWEMTPAAEDNEETDEIDLTNYDTRPLGILTLVAAWIAAIGLNKQGAYEVEVFNPTVGRTIAGVVIGAVAIPSLVILLVGLLIVSSSASNPLAMITSLATTPFLLVIYILAGGFIVIVQFYTWAAANYMVAWIMGGKGSFVVHSQLLSIAYSAISLAGSILLSIGGSLVAVLIELAPASMENKIVIISMILISALGLSLFIYSVIMQGQALSVAHRLSWGSGIGTVILSTLVAGLLSILFSFIILMATQTSLGNLPFSPGLFVTPIP